MSTGVKVIKAKNDVPTIIEWDGRTYVLQHPSQGKTKPKTTKKPEK